MDGAVGSNEPPTWAEISQRLEAVKAAGAKLGTLLAKARAQQLEQCTGQLADALGVNSDEVGWQQLLSLAAGSRAIADAALGSLGDTNEERRQELLVSFGVAQQWAQVRLAAEQMDLRLIPDPDLTTTEASPMGDEGVQPGSPLEAELNASLNTEPSTTDPKEQ